MRRRRGGGGGGNMGSGYMYVLCRPLHGHGFVCSDNGLNDLESLPYPRWASQLEVISFCFLFSFFFLFQMIARENGGRRKKEKNPPFPKKRAR